MKDQCEGDEQSLSTRITPLSPAIPGQLHLISYCLFVLKLRIIVSKNMLTSFTVLGNWHCYLLFPLQPQRGIFLHIVVGQGEIALN